MIKDETIEHVYVHNFLGVILDQKLCWKPQINSVKNKIAKSIAIMRKSRHLMDSKALHTIYCTLVLPYISYCTEIWGNTYKNNLNEIFTLQKKALRIIHKTGYRDHTNPLFLHSKVMKFEDLVKYKTLQIMHKARNNLLPKHIQNMFLDRDSKYNLRGQMNFKKQRVRTTLKEMFITRRGVDLWNELEDCLKCTTSLVSFKIMYRINVFKKYEVEL